MEEITNKLKTIIGGLTEILISAIGLLVVVQIVFGLNQLDIVGNIIHLVNSFIGSAASLGSFIALIIVLSVLSKD
jgi:hypothetical protein